MAGLSTNQIYNIVYKALRDAQVAYIDPCTGLQIGDCICEEGTGTNTTYVSSIEGSNLRLTGSDGSIQDVDICQIVADSCPDTNTVVRRVNNTLEYDDELGGTTVIDLSDLIANISQTINSGNEIAIIDGTSIFETQTSLTYDAGTTMLTYQNEGGPVVNIDLSALTSDIYVNGASLVGDVLTLTDTDGVTTDITVDLSKYLTALSVVDTNSIDLTLTGDAENGWTVQGDIILDPSGSNILSISSAGLLAEETITSIQADLIGNNLEIDYTNEAGTQPTISVDFSQFLDDTDTTYTFSEASGILTITPSTGTPTTFDICQIIADNCAVDVCQELIDNACPLFDIGGFQINAGDSVPAFHQQENVTVDNSATDNLPASGNEGDTYYNSTTGNHYVHDGTGFVLMGLGLTSTQITNPDGSITYTLDNSTGNIVTWCQDSIDIVDSVGVNVLLDGCSKTVLLDRDMEIQTLTNNGSVDNSITTAFADAVLNGDSFLDITNTKRVVSIAASSASNSGNNSIVSGNNPTNSGGQSFLTGTNAQNTANNAIVFGGSSINSGNHSIVGGNGGTNNSALSSTVIGNGVTNTGNNSIVSGVGANNSGAASIVSGVNATNTGSTSIVSGNGNNNNGNNNVVSGNINTLESNASAIFGTENVINTGANNSLAVGFRNIVAGENAQAFGSNNEANAFNQMVIGEFADTTNTTSATAPVGADHLFLIGNGGGTASLGNAFGVRRDGVVQMYLNSIIASPQASTASAVTALNGVGTANLESGALVTVEVTVRTNRVGAGPELFQYNATQTTWELVG